MRAFMGIGLLLLAACRGGSDWRAEALASGEEKIRQDLGDPLLKFSEVQVVGDASTGQVCGRVFGKTVSNSIGAPARFIVYIDGTAGPWIEGQQGHRTVTDQRFDFAWKADCVGEGWHAQ